MRILKIELQNINSLRSDEPIVIDFESSRFRDVGLFAITGPTGAGKTTLLDAITIALYHNVPRFNQSHSKGSLVDVISYGASEAMSRVTFLAQGVRYESFWGMRVRQTNGKVLATPQETIRLKKLDSEEIIYDKKRNFEKEIEQITQLNYQQFLRSVLLAQGEFAAFLSAPAKDKGALLEQITGEEIYKRIGEVLGDKLYEEERKLKDISAQINNDDLLDEEKKEELKQEQELLQKQIAGMTAEVEELDKIISWYKRNEELSNNMAGLQLKRAELRTKEEANRKNQTLLELHLSAEPYKEHIQQLEQYESSLQRLLKEKQELQKQIEQLRANREKVDQQHQKDQEILQQTENTVLLWQPKLEEVAGLDADILANKEQLAQKNKSKTGLEDSLKKGEEKKQTLHIQIKQAEDQLQKINDYLLSNRNARVIDENLSDWSSVLSNRKGLYEQVLKKENSAQNLIMKRGEIYQQMEQISPHMKEQEQKKELLEKDLDKLQAELKVHSLEAAIKEQEQLLTERELLREIHEMSRNYQDEQKRQKERNEKLEGWKQSVIILREKLATNADQQKNLQALIQDAEKIVELERAIKNYEDDRNKLVEGEPCPLCGSTDHPYVTRYALIELSASQNKLAERKQKEKQLVEEDKELNKQLTSISVQMDQYYKSVKEAAEQIISLQNQFVSKSTEYTIDDSDKIKMRGLKINEGLDKLRIEIELHHKKQTLKEEKEGQLKHVIEQISLTRNNAIKLEEQLKALVKQVEGDEKEKLALESQVKDLELTLHGELKKASLDLCEALQTNDLVDHMKSAVLNYRRQEDVKKEWTAELTKLKGDLENINEHNDSLKKDIQTLEQDIVNTQLKADSVINKRISILPISQSTSEKRNELAKQLEQVKALYDQSKQQLELLTRQLDSNVKLHSKVHEDIQQLDCQVKEWTNKLSEALQHSVFKRREDIQKALLTSEKKTELQALSKDIEDEKTRLEALELQLEEEQNKLKATKTIEQSLEETQQLRTGLMEDKDRRLQRLGEIRQRFELDRQITERNEHVVNKIREQELQLKKYRELNQLLGGSRHAFNTYVQRLTLKNLIHLANRHLYELNRRYSLKMNEIYKNGEELNFMLVDHYQTDETRLVDTSSGGEKFIISLALALGLSDLASRNVTIGSLFIDEGFGTLDQSTLETVIATLATLQSKGKMIGVISHVENLKERISTQIQVNKKQNGISEICIV